MATTAQTLQPAIGLAGLNALSQATKIRTAYSSPAFINSGGGSWGTDKKKVSITDKIPLVGHWTNQILHKYHAFRPLAGAIDWYDNRNRAYAEKEFTQALAHGPATREGRQGLAYHTWGYLCDSGHDLLDLGSNIAGLYSFYMDFGKTLAVALAPETEGATLAALPEMEASQRLADVLSTGLALSAAEAGAAFLDYRAVQSQDGNGDVAEIKSKYQENTTERLFAHIAWATKMFKFLSPQRQIATIQDTGGFMSRAEQWVGRMTNLIGSKIGKSFPGVAKAAAWAKQIVKIYGYLKKAKDVGKSLWAIIKDPALILWKTARFGVDLGKRALNGAKRMGTQAAGWIGNKASAGRNWIKNKAIGTEHWAENKAQSASRWLGKEAHAAEHLLGGGVHDAGQWTLHHRAEIGEALHQASDVFGVMSAATGVAAAGLALTGVGLPVAGVLGTASLTFAAAAAASRAWYSTSLAVGTMDGSVSVGAARGEAKGAAMDTALVLFTGGVSKVEELAGAAQKIAEGKSAVAGGSAGAIQARSGKALGAFQQLSATLKKLESLPLRKLVKDAALAKRLKFLTTALKAADFVNSVVGMVTSPLSAAATTVMAVGKALVGTGKAAVQSAAQWGAQKVQQVSSGAHAVTAKTSSLAHTVTAKASSLAQTVTTEASSLAQTVTAKASSAAGSVVGALKHGFSLHRKALPGTAYENDPAEQAARKHEQVVSAHPAHATHPAHHAAHAQTRHAAAKSHGPTKAFLARQAQYQSVMAAARKAGDAHPEVTAAQWALESGWGSKQSGKNNFFGIKSTDDTGTLVPTHEVVGGKRVAVKARFADYKSLDEGIAAHSQFLSGRRYAQAGYNTAKTPGAAIDALVKGHYATDPKYADKLLPMIRRYAPESMTAPTAAPSPAASPAAAASAGTSPAGPALQRSGHGDHPDVNPAALRADLRKQSSGFVPDSGIRGKLGGHLGFDPGGARLHTGPAAAQASRALNAEAFTIGNDVFFGGGRFDPHTPKGLGLIAHELTHVGQQTGTTGGKTRFFTEQGGDQMEREAQQTGERVLANAGSRSGLFVEDYIREYEGELSQSDQQRLDRISVMALTEVQRMLGSRGVRGSLNANALDVQIELDLSEMSDGEAAKAWAETIVESVCQSAGSASTEPSTPYLARKELDWNWSDTIAPQDWKYSDRIIWNDTPGGVSGRPNNTFVNAAIVNTKNPDPAQYETIGQRSNYYEVMSDIIQHSPSGKDVKFFDAAAQVTNARTVGAVEHFWGGSFIHGNQSIAIYKQINEELFEANMTVIHKLLYETKFPTSPKDAGSTEAIPALQFDLEMVEKEQGIVGNYLNANKETFSPEAAKDINNDLNSKGIYRTLGQYTLIAVMGDATAMSWAKKALNIDALDFFNPIHRIAIGKAKVYHLHDLSQQQYSAYIHSHYSSKSAGTQNTIPPVTTPPIQRQALPGTTSDTGQDERFALKIEKNVTLNPTEIAKLSTSQKIEKAIEHSLPLLPGDVRDKVAELISPSSLAIIAGMTTVWGISHFFGVGEIVDVALLGVGALMMGKEAFTVGQDLGGFINDAVNAKTDEDLNRSAQHFAKAVSAVGIDTLSAILLHKAGKAVKGNVAKGESAQVGAKTASGSMATSSSDVGMKSPAKDVLLLEGPRVNIPKYSEFDRGAAVQGWSPAAVAAKASVEQGATLYRIGTMGRSGAAEGQYWSLEKPTAANYLAKYGIPNNNAAVPDFYETATIKPGAKFITRVAPGADGNPGGSIEVVVDPGGIKMTGWHAMNILEETRVNAMAPTAGKNAMQVSPKLTEPLNISSRKTLSSSKPHLATGAEVGLEPTPETIRTGTVRMEAHPKYAQVTAKLARQGFQIKETSGDPHVSIVEVVSKSGEVLRVERVVYVRPGMRFLDLEHEVGHVRQFTGRLQDKLLPTERVLENGSKVQGAVFTAWMDAITEYHNRLGEYLRLRKNGASHDLLKKHAEGVRRHRILYVEKGLKGRRSPSQMEWAHKHFPDIPKLEELYVKARGKELE